MSHTNQTANYELPQFLGTDKPSWLNDINPSMLAIDTAIKSAKDTADGASTTATTANNTANNAKDVADTNKLDIDDIKPRLQTTESTISSHTISISNLNSAQANLNETLQGVIDADYQTQIDTKIKNEKGVSKIWCGTQSEYDAISVVDPSTLYFIKEA